MALYNALFEAASKLKKAAQPVSGIVDGAAKTVRDTASVAAKQAEAAKAATKAAGPALGKVAKYAAYPVGLGAGVGVGAWAAGAGAASAIDNTGQAVKQAWTPGSIADGGKMLFGLLLLGLFLGGLVYLYKVVTK